MEIRRLDSSHPSFSQDLDALLAWGADEEQALEQTVNTICSRVRHEGDRAVLEYTHQFDRREASALSALEVPRERLQTALASLEAEQRWALEGAAERIRAFHARQRESDWSYTDGTGTLLGQKITPLERVGVYIPGGTAAYPSTVLMNVIPARVAGVEEIIMTVPAPQGRLHEIVLAAAEVAGVDRVVTVGGAQAVAALAYGTESLPAVDKIVGPGNRYVAGAKRLVFGRVGIDMVAGPSEVVVVAEGGGDPEWLAMDLLAQAEHDEHAQAILISPDAACLEQVATSLQHALGSLSRAEIAQRSLENRGGLIRVQDLTEAVRVVDRIAPEHLQLVVADPWAWAGQVRHAGAIFLGAYAAEVMGDYVAGPNHVLPTAGTARFSSPLGVYDFQKRTSLVECTRDSGRELGRMAAVLARSEGLTAHAFSAEHRVYSHSRQEGS